MDINFINVALIITSVALIVGVLLQSKGAGLGGRTGADTGSVFTARRGVEKVLFYVTIVLAVLFFGLALLELFLFQFLFFLFLVFTNLATASRTSHTSRFLFVFFQFPYTDRSIDNSARC